MLENKNIKNIPFQGKKNFFRYFLFFIYFLLSVFIVYFLYRKTSFKVLEIYEVLVSNYLLFFVGIFFSFLALVLKVLRWNILIDVFLEKKNFIDLLKLSSIASVLNSFGLSLFITDGLKSGVLAIKEENFKNKAFMFFSSYADRLVGLVVAFVIILSFIAKKFFLTFIILFLVLVLFFFVKFEYKGLLLSFFITFLSYFFDSLSLYFFLVVVWGQKVDFWNWFAAFVAGGLGSVLSIFGGLGGRAIGISLVLSNQNVKIAFMLDILYYLMQLIASILALFISLILKDKFIIVSNFKFFKFYER